MPILQGALERKLSSLLGVQVNFDKLNLSLFKGAIEVLGMRVGDVATVARVNRPGELLRAAYLVDRGATATFSARVQTIQDENPQLRITCTGPWPPYSFATQ